MNATWLISALFNGSTRIGVSWQAEALTPQPPSALCEPLATAAQTVIQFPYPHITNDKQEG